MYYFALIAISGRIAYFPGRGGTQTDGGVGGISLHASAYGTAGTAGVGGNSIAGSGHVNSGSGGGGEC